MIIKWKDSSEGCVALKQCFLSRPVKSDRRVVAFGNSQVRSGRETVVEYEVSP